MFRVMLVLILRALLHVGSSESSENLLLPWCGMTPYTRCVAAWGWRLGPVHASTHRLTGAILGIDTFAGDMFILQASITAVTPSWSPHRAACMRMFQPFPDLARSCSSTFQDPYTGGGRGGGNRCSLRLPLHNRCDILVSYVMGKGGHVHAGFILRWELHFMGQTFPAG